MGILYHVDNIDTQAQQVRYESEVGIGAPVHVRREPPESSRNRQVLAFSGSIIPGPVTLLDQLMVATGFPRSASLAHALAADLELVNITKPSARM